MTHKQLTMRKKKRIALVAHDNMKSDLYEWATYNKGLLEQHELYATGTTGTLLEQALNCNRASADFIISSPLMADEYERLIVDYEPYRQRLQSRSASREGGTHA